VAVLSLYVLYVIGINAFLSTSMFGGVVNQDAAMLDVHYRKGWSIFPGRIHARDLSIRGSDSNVEWVLLRGDFGLVTTVRGLDPDSSTLDLSGSGVAMREVSVDHASAETAHWKGDALLEKATLRLREDEPSGPNAKPASPALDAIARLDADDARPLLGVLLRDSVPKFLVGLADMPRLRAYARVHVAPEEVVLSDVSASGGDIALRGSFALHGDDRRGAFVVEKGPVSVGLRLDEDGAKPRFFDLDDWLEDQERNVKAKTRAAPHGKLDGSSGDAPRNEPRSEKRSP